MTTSYGTRPTCARSASASGATATGAEAAGSPTGEEEKSNFGATLISVIQIPEKCPIGGKLSSYVMDKTIYKERMLEYQ